MRTVLLGAVLLGVLAGGGITAYRAFSDGGDSSAQREGTPTPEAGSPGALAAEFAAAWSAGNTTALYALLHPDSQATTSAAAFEAAYDGFATETTLSALEATVAEVDDDGASVSVRASTRYFAVLEYTVKIRFQRDPAGARRIAWDTTAIHPDLLPGIRFLSEVRKPERGAIYDRNGVALAITAETRMLGLNRSAVVDRSAYTASALSLGVTPEQVDTAFASPLALNQRVPVAPLPDAVAEQAALVSRATAGMLVYFDERRTHPLGAAAAHVVGYTRELTAEELEARAGRGYAVGDRIGAIGIEAGMDDLLAGKPGGELRLIDASGAVVRIVASSEPIPSADVHTTLDASLLVATYERLAGRAGSVVVLEPTTNAILALNSSPSFDPDAFERGDSAAISAILATPGEPLNNRATVGLYSAGSTFKLITGAAGMVYGGLTPTDRIDCTAIWSGVNPPLRNWEGAQGPLTIAEGLMRSCNPVFYEIGFRLNASTDNALSRMAREFGFGAPTGVVGFYEESGLVPDADWKQEELGESWFAGDDINLAIGQGALLVTTLQLANAYSTFVVGELRSPVVVQGEAAAPRGTLPLTPEQKAHLLRGLELVT
ncbi:MAG TPA: penicillin-binding transpeptidase domain-containing protein, partial [Tepidiformaceae bacterium]|nr:penicillin-binding transpeptidase domain-containing protein [Tepidiformaceae bacterium]